VTPPAATWARDSGTWFYRACGLAALAVTLAGFFLTYLRPMALGKFKGPMLSHLHGGLLGSWLVLVIAQVFLVRWRFSYHRTLGWIALVLAPAIAISTVMIGAEASRRDMLTSGPSGADNLVGTATTPTIFLLLVLAALLLRRRPQWHKRLIFIATVAILWPAWFRWRHFLPAMPRPDIWLGVVLADLPLVVAVARDQIRFGAIHPAYLTAGVAFVAEQIAEVLLFGTPGWHRLAMTMLGIVP